MYQFEAEAKLEQWRRANIAWNLLLASAILILPVLILLPLAYVWRRSAFRTIFASHFQAVIRYAWFVLAIPVVFALSPWEGVGIAAALVIMFIICFAAYEGRKAATRGLRYNGVLA